MKQFRFHSSIFLFLLLASIVVATAQPKPSDPSPPALGTVFELDKSVVTGTLSNGLTYFIRKNQKPENRAELRLIVKAGSILEDEDQRGLAHFVEHMAFNGTKNFRKQALVEFLESIGMRFGADLNAYTGFDETVYMLQVPTDSMATFDRAFQILEDWAHNISFDDTEIEKERGVVIEEWRSGRGADARMRDKQFPVLFHNSRYASRLPIGDKAILDTFAHERIRQFYRDWYRPELMAVVAVGDFDVSHVQKLIHEHFASIPSASKPRDRTYYPVPDHRETLYAIASDPEATRASVNVYFKHPKGSQGTVGDYRRAIVEQLFSSMLNQRLHEVSQQAAPPFQYAFGTSSSLTPTKDAYLLGAGVNDDGILTGLSAVLTETERARRFGFTDGELNRMKTDFLRSMETAFDERDKSQSSALMEEYTAYFLTGAPAPGIAIEYELMQRLLPGITLQEINQLSVELMTPNNRVISINAPEKAGVVIPTEADLRLVFDNLASQDIDPYNDTASDEPLLPTMPTPGSIVEERRNDALGTIEWKLSNGARVVLKPTDFKNDEVSFSAFSPGGTSLVTDADFVTATSAASVVTEGGIGNFDQIQLQKALTGKAVSVGPYIGEMQEGMGGGGSPKDIEAMFQLIYLYFTAPRLDTAAFASYKSKMKGTVKNRSARPESVFGDTLMGTLSNYHLRRRPWTAETFESINAHRALEIYRDRFSDAGDFTFLFVGSIKSEELKPLVATYLASLPSKGRIEQWRDIGIEPPTGVVEKTVRKGSEPKSQVRLVFGGSFEWNAQNRAELRAVSDVLEITMRESLREEKGGVYGVGVGGSASRYPNPRFSFSIGFGCSPDRVGELTAAVFEQIDSLITVGPSAENMAKIRESARRDRETSLKENGYWLTALQYYLTNEEDPMQALEPDKLFQQVTPDQVRRAAKRYLDHKNYVKIVLNPETP